MFRFDLAAHGTDVRTEVLAGVTTFLSMVFILAVYPSTMSAIGLPAGGAAIPAFATAPAPVTVGFFMVAQIVKINFDDLARRFRAFWRSS